MRESWILEGRAVLQLEAAALLEAADCLDEAFDQAVALILGCEGRVIVAGMGKSGLVGRKLAATLASLGTPSAVVHPADALHGDLGMIRPQDLVLMLSYSGETDELLRLLWFLEDQGNNTILITGKINSTLGRRCSVVLNGTVSQEACPHNLAPTSSATVAQALGDALAVALAKARNFKRTDFARLHPSGTLGRQLLQRVGDRMHHPPLPVCIPSTSLRELISVMSTGRLGTALVLEADRLVGIVTDGDLRRFLEHSDDLSVGVQRVMTRDPLCVPSTLSIYRAKQLMLESRVSIVPVLGHGLLVGLLQLRDC